MHPMHGPNAFKLGVFSINADGGLALTRVPERWPAEWPDIVAVAQMADAAGFEFILPIARWKGFGGEINSREWSYETLTFAAGLAGVTRDIALFSTVHVPMAHPVFVAKALTTVDHASNGRAGLNIVCGWNPEEFAMFGLEMIDNRYAQGLEWFEVMSRIYTADKPFDFDGAFYKLKNVSGRPRPLQQPRPVTLNAAFSPPGRDFAAKAADFLFTTFTEIDKGREHIEDMQARAAAAGRKVGVFTTCHVVCRPSQSEAEDYYHHYAVTMADDASVDHYMGQKEKFSGSHEADAYRLHRKRFAAGAGTYPLIGTPRHIAEEMVRMHQAGFAGTTVSFVNFKAELPYFIAEVLPLLREAGLRVK
ncbi:Flavin-dependent oxidoreductase, luciferase family (includes alkanesulfonate monooxygenase SsuD and methylene tetrahydromethanopterin reductase) [Rhizobiales bacterium GAS191]|nr:Flavin-dependent oxidoreductase, luciferase family (includes alkanesulfonate monooxygenase SsuD and methylene tetrahydromethanopterin reductase) [Rhizobiales bacterium GAS191]